MTTVTEDDTGLTIQTLSTTLENEPAAHALQLEDPAAEKVPEGHAKQALPERYRPALQTIGVQDELPAADVCPEGHWVQEPAPSLEKAPAAQLTQLEEPDAE